MTVADTKTLSDLHVLIVEDTPLIAKLITVVLGSIGVSHVTHATDGAEALGKIDEAAVPFGLVICDWMMPGMDGIEFLARFRADDKDTPFVMLTAKTGATEFNTAKNMGANYFLMKPLEHDELRTRLLGVIQAIVI